MNIPVYHKCTTKDKQLWFSQCLQPFYILTIEQVIVWFGNGQWTFDVVLRVVYVMVVLCVSCVCTNLTRFIIPSWSGHFSFLLMNCKWHELCANMIRVDFKGTSLPFCTSTRQIFSVCFGWRRRWDTKVYTFVMCLLLLSGRDKDFMNLQKYLWFCRNNNQLSFSGMRWYMYCLRWLCIIRLFHSFSRSHSENNPLFIIHSKIPSFPESGAHMSLKENQDGGFWAKHL